jgi:hypothetical protein
MPNKKSITNIDIGFYRESQDFKNRLIKVLINLSKEFKVTGLADCIIFLNPSSSFLNDGISLGIITKGFRYNGIFYGEKGFIAATIAAIQHILNRWQQYINNTGKVSAKQINREIRFLENLISRKAFDDQIFGSYAKGYTFNLRKYLKE